MFAKRSPAAFQPQPTPRRSALGRVDVRLAAGGLGALLLLSAAGAVFALADPGAGAPSARTPIAAPEGSREPPGWRLALSPVEPGPPQTTTDTLHLFAADQAPGGELLTAAAHGGQAVITMAGAAPGVTVPSNPLANARVFAADPLATAPISGLFQASDNGPLPVIGPGGRTPFQAYARPFTDAGRPKVAVVIGGLGLNTDYTRAAIERLPPQITLSFVPYSEGLQGWIDLARRHGHEVLLEVPMEPVDYPANDPGPYTLLANAQPQETTRRLEWLLSRATGYFGVTNYLGSRFLQADASVGALAEALKTRGLGFYDDGTGRGRGAVAGLRRASADRVIDDQQSAETIDRALLQLEASALQNGRALGSGFAYPVTLEQVARWAESVESRGYQLAPASAIAS